MDLTCYSCRHSIGTDDGLECDEGIMASTVSMADDCLLFEFEPGTDEVEKNPARYAHGRVMERERN